MAASEAIQPVEVSSTAPEALTAYQVAASIDMPLSNCHERSERAYRFATLYLVLFCSIMETVTWSLISSQVTTVLLLWS